MENVRTVQRGCVLVRETEAEKQERLRPRETNQIAVYADNSGKEFRFPVFLEEGNPVVLDPAFATLKYLRTDDAPHDTQPPIGAMRVTLGEQQRLRKESLPQSEANPKWTQFEKLALAEREAQARTRRNRRGIL
jgi:hypothetical protein